MQKGKTRAQVAATLALLAQILHSTPAYAEELTSLTGVGMKDSGSFGGVSGLSMGGGLPITISGTDMASKPNLNFVVAEPRWLEGMELYPPALSADEEFNSNTASGRLSYTTPSLMNLFNRDFTDFNNEVLPNGVNGEHGLLVDIKVGNGETLNSISCGSLKNCQLQYSRYHTPLLIDSTPANVVKGDTIQFTINPLFAHRDATPSDAEPFRSFHLGNSLMDTEDQYLQGFRLTRFENGNVNAVVGDQFPANNTEPAVLFYGGLAVNMPSSMHCNFNGDDCYRVKTHAKINSISHDAGLTTGGQTLTVNGYGLNGTDVNVLIDGVPCLVQQAASEKITCVTGAKETISATGFQPGHRGLNHIKKDGAVNFEDLESEEAYPTSSSKISTSFELQRTYTESKSRSMQRLSGWFTAPATAQYRFYISCQTYCNLFLSTTAFSSATEELPELTKIASRNTGSGWRAYLNHAGEEVSDWIDLEEGQSYYIKGESSQNANIDGMTVSLEVKLPESEENAEFMASHPKAAPAVQYVWVEQNNTLEEWTITVSAPDAGQYILNFLNPTTTPASLWKSSKVSASASASQMKDAVNGYYNNYWGCNIQVYLTMYDAAGVVTNDAAAAVTREYLMRVPRTVDQPTAMGVSATKAGTASTISIIAPPAGQQSSAPLVGKFMFQCTDPMSNVTYTSQEMTYTQHMFWQEQELQNSIPFLQNKIELQAWGGGYQMNGFGYQIRFNDFTAEVPLCEIISGVDTPLTGNNWISNATYQMNYGQSLFFEPMGLEFIRTDAQEPQVMVTLNGIPALCTNDNCGYQYISEFSAVTGQSLSADVLTIVGTELPTSDLSIMFGPTPCTATSQTATEIICTLDEAHVAGEWIAQIFTDAGLVTNDVTTGITVSHLVESVSPNVEINYYGGDLLTITGNNFGTNATAVTVTFADETTCVVRSVSMTEITCKATRFSEGVTSPLALTVTVNDVSDSSLTIEFMVSVPEAISLTPSSASPVLKTELTVHLSAAFVDIFAENFTATLYKDDDAEFEKILYVMSADQSDNSLVIKFPGAYSGDYHIGIYSTVYGTVGNDALALKVQSSITSVSPLSGSIYGGTLVTITGENFSDEPLDNPVKIGDHYCYVQTSSPTEITCRTDPLLGQGASDELVLVFLKTSEEAYTAEDILFSFVEPSSEVTNVVAVFDEATFAHQVIVSGSGLDETTNLWIDGFEQELVSADGLEAIFSVTNLKGVSSVDVQIYTSEGLPTGADVVHQLDFEPAVFAITPSIGSSGSSLIYVLGSGFGIETSGLNLMADLSELCAEVTITGYGELTCLTHAVEIVDTSVISVVIDSTAQETSFIAGDAIYSQSALYTVSAAAIDGKTITLTGTGFPTDGSFTGHVTFGGIEASTVTISDDVTIVASWDVAGIPSVTETPVVYFVHNTDSYELNAIVDDLVSVTKELIVTGSSTDLTCSFAGGCTYAIEASGLTAALMDDANSVEVCGSRCTLDTDLSDSDFAVCDLPKLATSYSAETFTITESAVLHGEVFPADSVLYDDEFITPHIDRRNGCTFGMNFKEGHVAVLDEAKVYINFITATWIYQNNLKLEGSNDNWATSTEIYTYGMDIHEGWNYINFRDTEEEKPAYNSYRFVGRLKDSCKVTEFKLTGVEAIADDATEHVCSPVIKINGETVETAVALGDVTYSETFTPVLESISPRFGSVLGGTTVTLTGQNLFGSTDASVFFDDRECVVESNTATEIVCVTSDKPYVPDEPRVLINIEGLGHVATQGLIFRYVSLYSDEETWGGDIPPIEGESILIPKGQHLLIDIDESPKLKALIVEGSLIFPSHEDPNHLRTFDAHYIMVMGGYLEVGTEEFPYSSKMRITMHSDRFDPYLPIYGNKVIGVRFGNIEMHGITRNVVWTRLADTAEAGATSITLLEEVDWVVGEEIVIAGTGWHNNDHETRIITSSDGTTISFAEPLVHKHLSVAPTYDGIEIPMRAEVGLLTRNIVFRGDPISSPADQYGAHIMIHSPGDESSVGRIEYVELKDVGQAFKLGRYPLHYHMIGTVHKSYVRGNAIHQTYNRAVTTHGVHYFRVLDNVAYNTMGHTFFIEDAAETKNIYDHNLAINVRASNSLLTTDQTPGGYWITHPDNVVINNAIAGTDAYGYWYDMQEHAVGPSFDINICPEFAKLGEFRSNTAHSVKKYGLRIHHTHIPRTDPCSPSPYDEDYLANNQTDPYWQNPKITAVYEDFVAWKCGKDGAITERTGAVIWKDFRIADVGFCAIEVSVIEDVVDDYMKVVNATVVGNTGCNLDEDYITTHDVWGIVGARTENFTVEGARFFHYEHMKSAALGSCSHCSHPDDTDSGGRTYKVSGLEFDDATVPRRIHWTTPFREIIYDVDGSLTNLGAGSWATFFYNHLDQPECSLDLDVFDGLICTPDIQLRRIAFYGYKPDSLLMTNIKVAKWDDDIAAAATADNDTMLAFAEDAERVNWSYLEQKQIKDPDFSWSFPIVTGHKYRFHWGEALDFTQMRLQLGERWEPTDLNVHMMTNYTVYRAAIDMKDSQGVVIENETYLLADEELQAGDNILMLEDQEYKFIINGKDSPDRKELLMTTHECIVDCGGEEVEEVELTDDITRWSDPSVWESGAVPVDGEEVVIDSGVNMVLDVDTANLAKLEINGRLTFLYNETEPANLTLRSNIIHVRAGELFIGNETHPFNGNATIILTGSAEVSSLFMGIGINAGNKILAVNGHVSMFGTPRDTMSRLRATCHMGDNSVTVYDGLDWKAGDRVALMPTALHYRHTDYMEIESYDNSTGVITFTGSLSYYHFGQSTSTATQYSGVDMRGEVVLLSRNVRIEGEDLDDWGGQITVQDIFEETGDFRTGQLTMDYVELQRLSQRNTFNAAIRIENALALPQQVTNSAVHGSRAWGLSVLSSANVFVQNTAFIGARAIGVNLQFSTNVTFDKMIVGDVYRREELNTEFEVDKEACYAICSYSNDYEPCVDVHVTNSIAAGCPYAGFVAPGHECDDDESDLFRYNVAHSTDGTGMLIIPHQERAKCYEGAHLAVYKANQESIGAVYFVEEMRMRNVTLIDSKYGINLQVVNLGDQLEINKAVLLDSIIYGETEAEDCPEGANEADCICTSKLGLMMFTGQMGEKGFHHDKTSGLVTHKSMSYGSWNAEVEYVRTTFKNFASSTTRCGAPQTIIKRGKAASDYIPMQKFYETTFNNVADDALVWIQDPNPHWAGPTDCAGFPCTAPNNVVMTFEGNTFVGAEKPLMREDFFQIISDNVGVVETIDNCEFKEYWNAWICQNDHLGVLVAIGDDGDAFDRAVVPVYFTNDVTGSANKVNYAMDNTWDGFYAGQKHKSQFPSIVVTNQDYTVEYTGTPFGNMRYKLWGTEAAMKVKVVYWNAGSYQVLVDGVVIEANAFDKATGLQGEITGSEGCGENRFVGGNENYLEFWIDEECTVQVRPVDSIPSNVRMDWTMDEFYAAGGTTSFADRVSAALGIHASQIKIVAVYVGSVVVDYLVEVDPESSESAEDQIRKLSTAQNKLISDNSEVFGAPILSASTDGEVLVEDPTYNPTAQANNVNSQTAAPTTSIIKPTETTTSTESTSSEPETITQTQTETVSIAVTAAAATTTGLIWIFVVLAIIVLACFGVGATVVYMVKKQIPQTPIDVLKARGHNNVEMSVGDVSKGANASEVDLGPQYHPEAEDFGNMDIFANKKRTMQKVDEEVLVAYDNAGDDQGADQGFGTEKKLLRTLGESVSEPISQQSSTNHIHQQD